MKGVLVLVSLLQILGKTHGKDTDKKANRRQMIFPNKFIPMLKESSLFRERSPSNRLSNFLTPKSQKHSVTGQTRQNLMNSMGMDPGQPDVAQAGLEGAGMAGMSGGMGGAGGLGGMGGGGGLAGGMGGGEGLGGIGGGGGLAGGIGGGQGLGAGAGGMAGAGGGGVGGEGGMDALGAQGGMGGLDGAQTAGGMMGMNAMSNMGGMGNTEGSQNPLEGSMGGNGMNQMGNSGTEGGLNDSPAGDPMGTLKAMLSRQGTNAALGMGTQAFGPGGEANTNVLSMLNQIVGKEIPSDTPVDPGSKSQQIWDQLQKGFESQKPAGVPFIDSGSESSDKAVHLDAPSPPENTTTNTPKQPSNDAPAAGTSPKPPLAATQPKPLKNPENAATVSTNPTTSNPVSAHPLTPNTAVNPTSTTNTADAHQRSKSHAPPPNEPNLTIPDTNIDEDEPLSTDMVKFLKGVKFVVSQQPGNDIILGKKFTSSVPSDLRQENGVMKNTVSSVTHDNKNDEFYSTHDHAYKLSLDSITENLEGLPFNRATLAEKSTRKGKILQYIKAANILQRAATRLKDPVAKKSTEVAIASILKVAASKSKKRHSFTSHLNLLNGGDVKDKLSNKYVEAARVLGTAVKRIADPLAKKSTEIGIAAILQVIANGDYPATKKAFVPYMHRARGSFRNLLNELTCCSYKKYNSVGSELANAIKRTLKSGNVHMYNI